MCVYLISFFLQNGNYGPAVGESQQPAAQLIIDGRWTHKMHKGLTTRVSHSHTNTHTYAQIKTHQGGH